MAYIRRLESGLWQATVRLPNGKRVSRTSPRKGDVKAWATKLEADIQSGTWRDPRLGRMTFGEWDERWWAARVVEEETRRGDRAQREHRILPQWQDWPLGKITRLDVQAWIRRMEKDGVPAPTIRRTYNLFALMVRDAVIEGLIGETPCVRIKLPPVEPQLPRWCTRDQVDRIKAELPTGHAVMTELMVTSGPRWGEAAAVVGRERPDGRGNPVDWARRKLRIVGSLTQYGKWKEYPKSSASRREIPLTAEVCEGMAALLQGRSPDSWVFVGRRRSPVTGDYPTLSGANWRKVWTAAIERANERIAEENRRRPPGEQIDPIPAYHPHDCRHTAASWLVQAGVPLYHVQHLLGHESFATTQRYAHLAPDAHDAITDAWERMATHERRTGRERKGRNGR